MKISNSLLLITLITAAFLFSHCAKDEELEISPEIEVKSIYPTSGGMLDTITIHGKYLPTDTLQLKVSINDQQAKIILATPDSLKFIIPKKVGSGRIMFSFGDKSHPGPDFTYNYKVTVTTIAGTGQVGRADGEASQASFKCPWGIASDINGDLFIADSYNRLIRKYSASDKTISTINIPLMPGDSAFYSPYNIALDSKTQNLYVTDFNKHLLKITPNREFSVIYSGKMPTTGIVVGPDDYLYMSNNTEGTIIRMDKAGQNTSIFASGLVTPRNMVFDKSGNMYVAAYSRELASTVINKISATGAVTMLHKDKEFGGWEIAIDEQGNFYQADHFNNVIRIIEKNGNIRTIAGSGEAKDVDGIGLKASFDGPQGITIDQEGNLYITTYNYDTATGNQIRKISIE